MARQCAEKGVGPPPRKRPNRVAASRSSEEAPNPSTAYDDHMPDTKSEVVDTCQGPSTMRQPISGCASSEQELRSPYSLSTSTSLVTSIEASLANPGWSISRLQPMGTNQQIAPTPVRQDGNVCPPVDISHDCSPFPFTKTFHGHDPGVKCGSSTATGSSEWSVIPCYSGAGPPLTTFTATQTGLRPTQSGQPLRSRASMTSDIVDTSGQRGIAGSWPLHLTQHRGKDHLIKIAEALEEQATWLGQLARIPRVPGLHESQLGMLQLQEISQPSDPNQVVFGALPTSSVLPYQFNPTTMSRPDGTFGTGFAPRIEGYGTWDADCQQQSPLQYGRKLSIAGPRIVVKRQGSSQAGSDLSRSDQGFISTASSGNGTGRERMRRVFHALMSSDHAAAARSNQDANF
ncbi:hypothetical protein LTR49_022838 [Elasticomyces elasticus]|nr:hypothetical protein LTR49_022838 [Elasticomyces elasticus]KAK5748190.1 hypothetical protein LTS12_021756 [Elasticomyces elasticus]